MIPAKQDKFKAQLNEFMYELQNSVIFPYVEIVVLYGSYARGEQNHNSDVDLLIQISENVLDSGFTRLKIRNIIADCVPYNPLMPEIDFHLVFSDVWKNSEDIFFREIRKDGYFVWKK